MDLDALRTMRTHRRVHWNSRATWLWLPGCSWIARIRAAASIRFPSGMGTSICPPPYRRHIAVAISRPNRRSKGNVFLRRLGTVICIPPKWRISNSAASKPSSSAKVLAAPLNMEMRGSGAAFDAAPGRDRFAAWSDIRRPSRRRVRRGSPP